MVSAQARWLRAVVATVVGLPLSIFFLPQLVPLLGKIGVDLLVDLKRLFTGGGGTYAVSWAVNTAGYFLWALFGVLGLTGLWWWALFPLRQRKWRMLVGVFILLGVLAASPWAANGVRNGDSL